MRLNNLELCLAELDSPDKHIKCSLIHVESILQIKLNTVQSSIRFTTFEKNHTVTSLQVYHLFYNNVSQTHRTHDACMRKARILRTYPRRYRLPEEAREMLLSGQQEPDHSTG
jgi:hypothetical protein